MPLDIAAVRASFPVIVRSTAVYADNAGGSACYTGVVERITDYLLNSNVQLGAGYIESVKSTKRVFGASTEIAELFNAASPDEVVLGPSSTQLLENLCNTINAYVEEGTEIIVTGEHEANVGPWKRLSRRNGGVIKIWEPTPLNPENPYSVALKLEELLPLITSKTRFVAISACSNVLGSLTEVKKVVQAIRATAKECGAPKVEICVDCVAYAPHRRMDVVDWDVDMVAFSLYKVYGPHISALYVRRDTLQNTCCSLSHGFKNLDDEADGWKIQPGGPCYELVYGSTAVLPYLLSLTPENDLKASFNAIAAHEDTLVAPLLTYLTAKEQWERGVRIVGDEKPGPTRAPTVCFVVIGENAVKSRDIVNFFDEHGEVYVRYGHLYSYGMMSKLFPDDVEDGAVRISLVHYNTVEEVERIIEVLRKAFAAAAPRASAAKKVTGTY